MVPRPQPGQFIERVRTDMLVRDAAKPVPTRRARVAVELHPVADAAAAAGLVPRDRESRARAFLRRGDQGWVATVDGGFAGWVWRSRVSHRDRYSGLRIRLAPDEAYAYALWAEPAFRPSGVAAVLMTTLLAEVAEDPALTRVYGWVDQRNRESQMLLRMLGFENVQTVDRLHVLRRRGRQLPRTARPAYGPLSRAGRHASPRSR